MKKSTELNLLVKNVKRKEAESRIREAEKIADELYDKILALAKESAEEGASKCNLSQEMFPDLYKSADIVRILRKKLRKEGIMLHYGNGEYSLDFRKWYKRIGSYLLALICNGILIVVVTINNGPNPRLILYGCGFLYVYYIMLILSVLVVVKSEYFTGLLEYKANGAAICAALSCMIVCTSLFQLI